MLQPNGLFVRSLPLNFIAENIREARCPAPMMPRPLKFVIRDASSAVPNQASYSSPLKDRILNLKQITNISLIHLDVSSLLPFQDEASLVRPQHQTRASCYISPRFNNRHDLLHPTQWLLMQQMYLKRRTKTETR